MPSSTINIIDRYRKERERKINSNASHSFVRLMIWHDIKIGILWHHHCESAAVDIKESISTWFYDLFTHHHHHHCRNVCAIKEWEYIDAEVDHTLHCWTHSMLFLLLLLLLICFSHISHYYFLLKNIHARVYAMLAL